MLFGMTRIVNLPYEHAVDKVTTAMEAEGLAVLTMMDVHVRESLKEKLAVGIDDYAILAVSARPSPLPDPPTEQGVAAGPPCNIIVYTSSGQTRVSVLGPPQASGDDHGDSTPSIDHVTDEKLERALNSV